MNNTDFSALGDKLSNDSGLRSRFVADPGVVLRANGVNLSDDQLSKLRQQLETVTAETEKVKADDSGNSSAAIKIVVSY
jgi:hypothetical protein